MGVCATNCYFLYREGGTKAVVVDPAENGAGIFKLLSEKDFTVEAILLTQDMPARGVQERKLLPPFFTKN